MLKNYLKNCSKNFVSLMNVALVGNSNHEEIDETHGKYVYRHLHCPCMLHGNKGDFTLL